MKRKGDHNRPRTIGITAFTELSSTNPNETRRFLEEAFGWKFDTVQMPQGQYLTHQSPEGGTVGIRPAHGPEPPRSTNYVLVDDLEVAEKKVRQTGGEILLPRTDIPDMGSFFWFKIPAGPIMACWQDAPKAKDQRKS